MDTAELTRFRDALEASSARQRCECQHDNGNSRCRKKARYRVTLLCSAVGCNDAVSVHLLCQVCLDTWRWDCPGVRLRVRRL